MFLISRMEVGPGPRLRKSRASSREILAKRSAQSAARHPSVHPAGVRGTVAAGRDHEGRPVVSTDGSRPPEVWCTRSARDSTSIPIRSRAWPRRSRHAVAGLRQPRDRKVLRRHKARTAGSAPYRSGGRHHRRRRPGRRRHSAAAFRVASARPDARGGRRGARRCRHGRRCAADFQVLLCQAARDLRPRPLVPLS